MRRNYSSLTALVTGFIFLAVVYVAEVYSGISGSVAYILVVLTTLWLSWNSPYVTWTGVIATVFILAGFFTIDHNGDIAILMNRTLGLVTIWLAVIFAYRYQNLYEAEEFQKRQLKALFDNATEGMIFTNAQGEIVGINPAAEHMFGYEHGELNGRKIEVLIPERYVKGHVSKRENLFANPVNKPKGAGRELLGRRKNGEEFYSEIGLSFFIDRQRVFYIAFIVDISERKRQREIIEANVKSIQTLNQELDAKVKQRTAELETALHNLEALNDTLTLEISERRKIEERLIKSQALYSAIARNFPEGVIGVLNKEMKYVFADGQELKKIGFLRDDPVGRRLFEQEDSSVTAHAESMMGNVFKGESVSFDVDLNNNIYNLIAVPLPDGKGDINEILVVMKNITDRKAAERKLVRTIQKEKELSSLKSRFVTMASHEFRTPLSTMLSSVFLLQNYTGDRFESQKKTHLDRIKRSIVTLTELMNDFLSIGKLEEGKVKAV
ncbi:MAG TPA: PAS domain S-box protein, partial [Chryseosolibacter sp.]